MTGRESTRESIANSSRTRIREKKIMDDERKRAIQKCGKITPIADD